MWVTPTQQVNPRTLSDNSLRASNTSPHHRWKCRRLPPRNDKNGPEQSSITIYARSNVQLGARANPGSADARHVPSPAAIATYIVRSPTSATKAAGTEDRSWVAAKNPSPDLSLPRASVKKALSYPANNSADAKRRSQRPSTGKASSSSVSRSHRKQRFVARLRQHLSNFRDVAGEGGNIGVDRPLGKWRHEAVSGSQAESLRRLAKLSFIDPYRSYFPLSPLES